MVAAIVKSNGERDTLTLLVEQRGRVEPAGIDNHSVYRGFLATAADRTELV